MGLAAPTAMDHFAESASTITDGVPSFGNTAIYSLSTAGLGSVNFYCSPNPVAKVLLQDDGCSLIRDSINNFSYWDTCSRMGWIIRYSRI